MVKAKEGQSLVDMQRERGRTDSKDKIMPESHKTTAYTDTDYDSAVFMLNAIKDKFPRMTKEPNLEVWADDLRKMRTVDNLTGEEIAGLFMWAHQHTFWSANIRSPGKLRKQWDTLSAQRQQEKSNGPNQFI